MKIAVSVREEGISSGCYKVPPEVKITNE